MSERVLKIMLAIELAIVVIFFNIAKYWPDYTMDAFFFVICLTFANMIFVFRTFGKVYKEKNKYGAWIFTGILILLPFIRFILFR
ncbi:hypothetical protein CLHUN_39770 [Ruminiclostridium hungatei]|uniref:Uncharacterized protein n=1 Tax=Ruminiclostridium hungatei TaxID=48256 RepID=A0A1V4SEA9_RUMHU|nr:hypothetical protein [Ruminiclostridium hungatei]OPX42190.1 hypothetical protein CLHUN_39770 [Ruminiclostridium hungatei]